MLNAMLMCLSLQVAQTDTDLANLKKQRDLADAFMRQATQTALDAVAKDTKDPAKAKIADYLRDQLKRERYFVGQAAEFAALLDEADRVKVKIGDQALLELVKASVRHGLSDKAIRQLKEEVRKALRRYFNKKLERRPVVLPFIMET